MRLMRFTPLLALLALSSCGKLNPTTAPTTGAEVAPAEAQDLARSRPDPGSAGAVYTLTNDAGGNAVLAFARRADGGLAPPTMHPTGGRGAGVGLGNQNAVILSDEDDLLFAVNAGSNDISVMKLTHRGPVLHDRTPSGGERPISLAMHGKLLYVLNAGGPGNITGFRVGGQVRLKPIPSSTRPLGSVAAGPAQIGFSPDGNHLVVTEKATHTISVYEVTHGGRAFGPRVQPSHGQTPFGFAFDRRGDLVVSEAFGGAADLSAASSYALDAQGALTTVSGSVPTTEAAACWGAGGGLRAPPREWAVRLCERPFTS